MCQSAIHSVSMTNLKPLNPILFPCFLFTVVVAAAAAATAAAAAV